eukprot:SAG31_NODE_1052_length_10154_cov_2.814818_2_plen_41_part_00
MHVVELLLAEEMHRWRAAQSSERKRYGTQFRKVTLRMAQM